MSALSDATAVRRSLIETIALILEPLEMSVLSHVSEQELTDLIADIADNLIDSEWVTRNPDIGADEMRITLDVKP